MNLPSGYQIREMQPDDFFKSFGKIYPLLFGEDHTFFPSEYYTAEEKKLAASLRERVGNLFALHLGLFSPENEFVGFSFGYQENEETFYMMASAVLSAHRNKGLYTALVKYVLEKTKEAGFQKIYGTHCATNNAVLIPKMKLGFIFSKVELSDMFGTILHLQYFTNPLRRKIMDYRSGLRVPDEEIKSVMKFNLSPNDERNKE